MFDEFFSGIGDWFSGLDFGGGEEALTEGFDFGDPSYSSDMFDLSDVDFSGMDGAAEGAGAYDGFNFGGGSEDIFSGFDGASPWASGGQGYIDALPDGGQAGEFSIGGAGYQATPEGMPLLGDMAPGTGGASAGAVAGPMGPEAAQGAGEQTKSMLDKALEQIQNNPLAGAGLALGAGNVALQQFRKPAGNERALNDLARRQQELSEGQIARAEQLMSGDLSPQQKASITARQRAADAATRSQFASMGLGSSTMRQTAMQQNAARAAQEEQAALDSQTRAGNEIMSGATRLLGGATSAYDRLLRGEMADDEGFQSALASLAKALGSFGQRPVVVAR